MEQTFMTIHNLSHDANIIFASESVVDILGYQPQEIQGKSCFDYFHPDEISFARSIHKRGVLLDKAAVLHYVRMLSKDGRFVNCECCFTVVHDVLVACTSIYRRGKKSERRAIEAPHIRKIFSSSPRDPRYHMLEYLSPKFRMQPTEREPRAALILNRFTRTLTIMFATDAVSSILGVGPDQLQSRSLYECIAENCWGNAIKCLENAKANDSIAYLRFWSRDPRVDDNSEGDEDGLEDETSENDSDGGVRLKDGQRPRAHRKLQARHGEPIPTRELEAVVSCTSDGLVMVLRKARPPIPSLRLPILSADFENNLFTGPWNEHPIRASYPTNLLHTFNHIFHSNSYLHGSMSN
ncbi:hypothetical protein F4860DRAFT_88710 [Xylaria cubensis]|nr:hypothetical protein F4860DRAFT_88710 [Xylaria cubensis]